MSKVDFYEFQEIHKMDFKWRRYSPQCQCSDLNFCGRSRLYVQMTKITDGRNIETHFIGFLTPRKVRIVQKTQVDIFNDHQIYPLLFILDK